MVEAMTVGTFAIRAIAAGRYPCVPFPAREGVSLRRDVERGESDSEHATDCRTPRHITRLDADAARSHCERGTDDGALAASRSENVKAPADVEIGRCGFLTSRLEHWVTPCGSGRAFSTLVTSGWRLGASALGLSARRDHARRAVAQQRQSSVAARWYTGKTSRCARVWHKWQTSRRGVAR